MTLSFSDVADIVKIIDSSSCDEVVLELEGAKLVVRRGGGATVGASGTAGGGSAQPAAPQPAAAQAAPVSQSQTQAQSQSQVQPQAQPQAQADEITVCSPMVGTFYSRPSPDDAPFVEAGGSISAGAPLCMVEVMKLFTTIEATTSGTVTAVLAQDGQLVEFDQPLFVIRPD